MSVTDGTRWPARRFSQAISEGDGISVIPRLRGDLATLARAAEEAGAEALAVDTVESVRLLRTSTELPLLVRSIATEPAALEEARAAGADACVLTFEHLADEAELLEELVSTAAELGLECALDVRDEEELEQVLVLLDPEILVLSEREPEKDEVDLERTLDLLPDVPAGKLVVSESRATTREQILELERAGVDAVLLGVDLPGAPEFSAALADLTGRPS
jgi:indole-3-glycerol phosphate synthase